MNENLLEELISHIVASPPQKIESVFIGQAFTAARLNSGEIGLALTPLTRFDSCIGTSRLAGTLTRHNTHELAKFLLSGNAHLRSVGLAAVNAVLQGKLKNRTDFLEGDFLEFLDIKASDNVAMIDYYTTKIEFLKRARLTIFDNRFAGKRRDIAIFPISEAPKRFPQADVVIIPPSFLHNIDEFIKYASKAREFVLVHPTTPPLPEPFFRRGVTFVASMMIREPDSVFRCVAEGAGTTLFKRFCKKIAFRKTN